MSYGDTQASLGALRIEESSMADQKQEKPAFLFNLGDRVKIHHSRGMHGARC